MNYGYCLYRVLSGTVKCLVMLVIIYALFSGLMSCSKPVEGENITFEYAPDTLCSECIDNFSEDNCMVLRCSSFIAKNDGIMVKTSKSKSMKTSVLVFVDSNPSDYADGFILAATPVNSKEYEYNMNQAQYYLISSFGSVIKDYGIPFQDWQTGAISNSDNFPCCE
jgi:hypothetical protein